MPTTPKEPRVFCAYRLKPSTRETIKKLKPLWKVKSESRVIDNAIELADSLEIEGRQTVKPVAARPAIVRTPLLKPSGEML